MTAMQMENKQQDICRLIRLSSLGLECLTCKLRNFCLAATQVVSREEKISCRKRRGAIFQRIKHSSRIQMQSRQIKREAGKHWIDRPIAAARQWKPKVKGTGTRRMRLISTATHKKSRADRSHPESALNVTSSP